MMVIVVVVGENLLRMRLQRVQVGRRGVWEHCGHLIGGRRVQVVVSMCSMGMGGGEKVTILERKPCRRYRVQA